MGRDSLRFLEHERTNERTKETNLGARDNYSSNRKLAEFVRTSTINNTRSSSNELAVVVFVATEALGQPFRERPDVCRF